MVNQYMKAAQDRRSHHQKTHSDRLLNYGRLKNRRGSGINTLWQLQMEVLLKVLYPRIAHWEADQRLENGNHLDFLSRLCQDHARLLRTIKQRCARMCTRWLSAAPDQACLRVGISLVGRWL